MKGRSLLLIASALALLQVAWGSQLFEPLVLIWAGDIPGYGDAIESIISEGGAKTILVRSEGAFRGLINLPQVTCVVLATFTPSDYEFLGKFSGVLQRHFEEGGSLVGIGPVCSSVLLEPLATTIFPIQGNATAMGGKLDGVFGLVYAESEAVEEISSSLPREFALTQFQSVYRSGREGPLDPTSQSGTIRVVYRDRESGIPQVVAFEREAGGRSVSLPGCFIATIERLPYYWERLLEQEEFALLLQGCIAWAMEGSQRYENLALTQEQKLTEEAARISEAQELAESKRRKDRGARLALLGAVWAMGLIVDALLIVRYVIPRLRD